MTVAGYDRSSDSAWRRMFERDKDLLRNLGIPLELQPTDVWEVEHGYVVPGEDYALPDPQLTDEERAALWLAAQVVQIGGRPSGPEALFKLGGSPIVTSGEPLAADLGHDQEVVAEAFGAIGERRRVKFHYRDTSRRAAPYGLVHRRGHWYLVAEDLGDATVKAFRVDRIDGLEAEGPQGAVTRPEGFDPASAIPEAPWEAGADDLQATVRFDAGVAWWARRQLTGETVVADLGDGAIEAHMRVANREAFIGWILGFEDAAEIIAPAELRDRLLARVEGTG